MQGLASLLHSALTLSLLASSPQRLQLPSILASRQLASSQSSDCFIGSIVEVVASLLLGFSYPPHTLQYCRLICINKTILDVLCSVQFAIQPLADRARGRWEQPRVDRVELLFHNINHSVTTNSQHSSHLISYQRVLSSYRSYSSQLILTLPCKPAQEGPAGP